MKTQRKQTRRKRRAAKIVAASLASAGGIVSILGGGIGAPIVSPSHALTQADIAEQGLQIYSLRPGISIEQAEQLTNGEMPDEVRDNIDAKSSVGKTTGLSKEDAITKTKKSDLYGEYDADDDEFNEDEYADEEYLFGTESSDSGTAIDPRKQRASGSFASSSGSSSTSSTDVSNKISKGTKDSFSGGSKTKPITVYASVGVACFIPTFGLFGVRDFIRNRKEEKNVKKGIEIIEAQRAEYFGTDKNGKNITDTNSNSTDTTDSDSDIDDELKDLKDSDDDDDDDDDDEPEPPKRKRRSLPKTPQGDGSGGDSSGGGGSSSGYDNDNGGGDDNGPSDDDIQRLGDIFNKS